ncbi:hypothetical protein ARMSODRAFT_1034551, partial [Armillaria solidipes]
FELIAEVPHAIFTAYLGTIYSFATGLVFLSLVLAMGNRTVLSSEGADRNMSRDYTSSKYRSIPPKPGYSFRTFMMCECVWNTESYSTESGNQDIELRESGTLNISANTWNDDGTTVAFPYRLLADQRGSMPLQRICDET